MHALPPPRVPASEYTEAYYRETCAGAVAWTRSEGGEIDPLYPGCLELAGLRAGEVLVDLGTGRGELLAAAVERGAARATGVEYSPAAVELAEKTLAARGVEDRARVLLADVRGVPLAGGEADLVTLLDVVEHLAPAELAAALGEAHRLLRPGGRIFIHTLPSRTLYDVTYRLHRYARPGRRRRWPADPRLPVERAMHVNEQTLGSLRRALRAAGFADVRVRPGEWMHVAFVPDEPARVLYHRLAAHRLTRRFGVADLWATGRAPAARSTR